MQVRIVGVAEGAYYAPQIVALRHGLFRDEGFEVTYIGTGDPHGLAAAVDEGRADVALGGLWRPLLFAQLGVRFVAFAQASAQADQLVFARVPREEFDWSSLSPGSLIVTSGGAPSPWFSLQEALRGHGVDLGLIRLIGGLPPAEAIHWFDSGIGAALEVSDLEAVALLRRGSTPIIRWREDIGAIPQSVYYTTPRWLERNRPAAIGLTRALGRAQQWIRTHEAGEIAEVVEAYFGSAAPEPIELLIETYRDQHLWPTDPALPQTAVDRWVQILIRGGLLSQAIPFDAVVDETIVEDTGRS